MKNKIRCPMTCPHGDQCTREPNHEGGFNHKECACNEQNTPIGEDYFPNPEDADYRSFRHKFSDDSPTESTDAKLAELIEEARADVLFYGRRYPSDDPPCVQARQRLSLLLLVQTMGQALEEIQPFMSHRPACWNELSNSTIACDCGKIQRLIQIKDTLLSRDETVKEL